MSRNSSQAKIDRPRGLRSSAWYTYSGFSACIHHITLPKHKKYFSRPATGSVWGEEDGRCGVRRWDRCVYHRFNLDSDSRAHHRSVARNRPNKVRTHFQVFDTWSVCSSSIVSWIITMLSPHQVRNNSYISSDAHRHTGFSVLPARPWSSFPWKSSSGECSDICIICFIINIKELSYPCQIYRQTNIWKANVQVIW